MAFSLRTRGHSEVGLVRNDNQDSAYISPSLIVVADGMGGAAAGDLASAVAIRELGRADAQNRQGPDNLEGGRLAGDQMLEVLGGALTKANDVLADLVIWDQSLEGMGTTVCGAMFSGSQYGICHIGDSRGYLLRDGKLRQLTRDHSWVQSLVDEGKISEQEALTHPHRSLLMKVLNGQPSHTPDFELVDAALGDRLLFCSDGLSGMVPDDVIAKLLTSGDDLDTIAAGLAKEAHAGGGLDNITFVIADVVVGDAELDAAAPQVLGAAATAKIPDVEPKPPLHLGEAREDTRRILRSAAPRRGTPAAPPHAAGLPAGVIDPDRLETIRYSPHLPSRSRRLLPLITSILVVLALLLAGFFGARAYLASQYFIGPDTGRVAVFQGAPEQVLGRELWTRIETSTVRIADLPPYYAGKVTDRDLHYESLDQAREALSNLGRMAERCIAERAAAASPPPGSAESPGATGSPSGPGTTGSSQTSAGAAQSSPGNLHSPTTPTAATTTPGPTSKPSPAPSNRPDLEACG